jgi:hypothetical protein
MRTLHGANRFFRANAVTGASTAIRTVFGRLPGSGTATFLITCIIGALFGARTASFTFAIKAGGGVAGTRGVIDPLALVRAGLPYVILIFLALNLIWGAFAGALVVYAGLVLASDGLTPVAVVITGPVRLFIAVAGGGTGRARTAAFTRNASFVVAGLFVIAPFAGAIADAIVTGGADALFFAR